MGQQTKAPRTLAWMVGITSALAAAMVVLEVITIQPDLAQGGYAGSMAALYIPIMVIPVGFVAAFGFAATRALARGHPGAKSIVASWILVALVVTVWLSSVYGGTPVLNAAALIISTGEHLSVSWPYLHVNLRGGADVSFHLDRPDFWAPGILLAGSIAATVLLSRPRSSS
jgi:hypothetical protein